MKYIVLNGSEKLYPSKEFQRIEPIDKKKDSFVDKERRIGIIQILLYLTIPQDDNSFEEYLEKQLLKDIKISLKPYNDINHTNQLQTLHYEYFEMKKSEIPSKKKIIKIQTPSPSLKKIIRLFIYIEIKDCSDLLMQNIDSWEKEFSNYIKDQYTQFLKIKMGMEIPVLVTDGNLIYPYSFHVYTDSWEYEIPDIALHFDPNIFQNSIEAFKKQVMQDIADKNIIFKIEQNEPNQTFSLILLHPIEAKKVLDSPLGALNPTIETYVSGDIINEESFDELINKYYQYSPDIRNVKDSAEIDAIIKKYYDSYQENYND